MPVKRRRAKRVAIANEIFAWESVFACGWDFFGEVGLMVDGVPGSRRDWTEAPETREAWNRLGETFLAEGRDAEWALKTFGRPRRDA